MPTIRAQACGFENSVTTISYLSISEAEEAYCTRITLPKNSMAKHSEQLINLFPANTLLFKSSDTFYLLTDKISHKHLQLILSSAMSQNLIASHYAIAVHPSAYSSIEQQGLRWKQPVTLVKDQTMSVEKTGKSSMQYSGTIFASSLTLVPGKTSVTQCHKRRNSFST